MYVLNADFAHNIKDNKGFFHFAVLLNATVKLIS